MPQFHENFGFNFTIEELDNGFSLDDYKKLSSYTSNKLFYSTFDFYDNRNVTTTGKKLPKPYDKFHPYFY